MKSRPALGAALLLLAVAAAGCAPRAPVGAPPTELTSAEVARLLAAPLDRIRTLQAGGVLRFTDHGRTQIAEIFLTFDADAGLRLDALTPLNTPLYTLVVAPDRVLLLDHLQRRAVSGPATAAAAARVLRFEVEPRLLREAAAGGLRRDAPPWEPTAPSLGDQKTLWWFHSADWRVGIDPDGRRPMILEIQQPELLRVAWEDRETIGGASVARRITIDRPPRRQSLVLRFSDVRVNQPVDRTWLAPAPPDGWRREQLGDNGRIGE